MHGVGLALSAALLFGAATPASKLLLGSFGAFQLAGLLYLGAALGVAPRVWSQRRGGLRAQPSRADALRIAGAVAVGGVASPVLLLLGLRASSAGNVSLWLPLETVATAVLGVLFFGEHLGRSAWAGVAGVVAAGALLAGSGGWPGLAALALVAAACVGWGLDSHWTALVSGAPPATTTLWKGAGAGAISLAVGLVAEPAVATPAAVLAALATGALCYGASLALFIAATHQLGTTRAQGFFAGAPFVGAGLSFAGLGEPFGAPQALALPLLAGSLAMLLRGAHAHPHRHAAEEHVHSHRHDDGHHAHAHPGLPAHVRHTHRHRHEPLEHSHAHWPDVHHRHGHGRDASQ